MGEENMQHDAASWNGDDVKELLEYESNPFDTDSRRASDVMRIFYQENLPLLPVVSRQNVLLGVITKDKLTAAMSDIENFELVKIDRFITSIAEKLSFEDLLPMVKNAREFPVINIFGEQTGVWSRIDLLEASDTTRIRKKDEEEEIQAHKEEQQLEWIIYLILEHIPRALYAMNGEGKTLFFNGHFEEKICEQTGWDDIDIEKLEEYFNNTDINDYIRHPGSGEYYFHNRTLDLHYERLPMKSNDGDDIGYLIYCPRHISEGSGGTVIDGSLAQQLEETERTIIVDMLRRTDGDEAEACRNLGVTKASLAKKMKKMGIVKKTP